MKKLLICIMFIIAFFLTSCNTFDSNSSDITRVKVSFNNYIYLNMAKEEVGKILGAGNSLSVTGESEFVEYEGLLLYYRNNRIINIEISKKKYVTYNNIKVGDSLESVVDKYKPVEGTKIGHTYIFKISDSYRESFIHYQVADNKITEITIYDIPYLD